MNKFDIFGASFTLLQSGKFFINDGKERGVVFGAVELDDAHRELEYVTGLTSLHASGSSELTAVIFSFKNSKGVASNLGASITCYT